jgi:hypothetical protein
MHDNKLQVKTNYGMAEQAMRQPDVVGVPLAYAEPSTDYDGVYAMPQANRTGANSLVRLTAEQEVRLQEHGFPLGLSQELHKTVESTVLRCWIIDNSGSMWTSDGHVLRGKGKNTRLIPCTRWAEMQATVECVADLAGLLQATTIFHMLNHPGDPRVPQKFSVAEHGSGSIHDDIDKAKQAMHTCQPQGPTPLSARLVEIREVLTAIAPMLGKQGQKATIVIATDGMPTDDFGGTTPEASREFVQTLRSLQNFPVWIVIRLCTDEDETRNFYNSLDEELELPLEVLDDHVAESKEVARFNNWLNYAQPLHRTRELGFQHRLFDLLDERPLNKDEVKEFLELLFGQGLFETADPHNDWKNFIKTVQRVVKNQPQQWNPRSQKMEPWVDIKKLEKSFGERLSLLSKLGSAARRGSRASLKAPK